MNAPSKPVVLIAEELSPATVEALGPDFEIRTCNGADRAELLSAIVDVDAILVRSATKVDAEALAVEQEVRVEALARGDVEAEITDGRVVGVGEQVVVPVRVLVRPGRRCGDEP